MTGDKMTGDKMKGEGMKRDNIKDDGRQIYRELRCFTGPLLPEIQPKSFL